MFLCRKLFSWFKKKSNVEMNDIDKEENIFFDDFSSSEEEIDDENEPDCIRISLRSTGNKFSIFENEILNEHNRYRALHECPPLRLSLKLCAYARSWAVLLAHSHSVVHRKNTKYGENLFFAKANIIKSKIIVQSWYREMRYYDFKNPGYNSKTTNFTQLIWKEASKIGVGAVRINRKTWVVANYFPKGNIPGQFQFNVPSKKIRHGYYVESNSDDVIEKFPEISNSNVRNTESETTTEESYHNTNDEKISSEYSSPESTFSEGEEQEIYTETSIEST